MMPVGSSAPSLFQLFLPSHQPVLHPPVALMSGGELVYFEMDSMGQLLELAKKDMDGDVSCLDVAPVLPGVLRCRHVLLLGTVTT